MIRTHTVHLWIQSIHMNMCSCNMVIHKNLCRKNNILITQIFKAVFSSVRFLLFITFKCFRKSYKYFSVPGFIKHTYINRQYLQSFTYGLTKTKKQKAVEST